MTIILYPQIIEMGLKYSYSCERKLLNAIRSHRLVKPLAQFCHRPTRLTVLSAPRLVQPTASDVSHPFDHVMVTVVQFGLKHLQVTNLEP